MEQLGLTAMRPVVQPRSALVVDERQMVEVDLGHKHRDVISPAMGGVVGYDSDAGRGVVDLDLLDSRFVEVECTED